VLVFCNLNLELEWLVADLVMVSVSDLVSGRFVVVKQ
jgi:hypothetical protein